jgi:hypothetical protein
MEAGGERGFGESTWVGRAKTLFPSDATGLGHRSAGKGSASGSRTEATAVDAMRDGNRRLSDVLVDSRGSCPHHAFIYRRKPVRCSFQTVDFSILMGQQGPGSVNGGNQVRLFSMGRLTEAIIFDLYELELNVAII